jgi:hypothetical protein
MRCCCFSCFGWNFNAIAAAAAAATYSPLSAAAVVAVVVETGEWWWIRITAAAAADRGLYVAAEATAAAIALKFHTKHEKRENIRQNETHYEKSHTND